MFKTILWATDRSENADRALPLHPGALATGEGAMLVAADIVHDTTSHNDDRSAPDDALPGKVTNWWATSRETGLM